ncbi:hypothetical protein NDU88_001059 [Pleurodeles waltl]|uniref:Uncharacterized protein n=1 Tax=Pleurodeles waltl TaxID=8319 RepID=A0AAV7R8M2_PLEWA|nr:hypothetical protein NDU88_001059 [Pleurodeles waltl]
MEQGQSAQPTDNGSCAPAPGPAGQGLQAGLGKMMEAMHSFMASAKALAGRGMDKQGACSRRACAGQGADITVPSKEVEKHKWKRKVKPEESMDNWLEAFAMLSTVIMEKFPEQGPALCKYNRVIYPEWGYRVAELRQGIQAKNGAGTRDGVGLPRN